MGGAVERDGRDFHPQIYKPSYRAAAPHWQREDIQVRTSYQDDPQDPSSYTFYTDNATSGSSYGLELEMDYFLSPKVEIQTNLSLLKTSYDTYVVGETNIKGREFPNAPAYTLNTEILQYAFDFIHAKNR